MQPKYFPLNFSKFPAHWNDLKPRHIRLFCFLFMQKANDIFEQKKGNIVIKNYHQYLIIYARLCGYILGAPLRVLRKLTILQMTTMAEDWQLLSFMFKGSTLTKNPFPRVTVYYKYWWHTFYAPAGDMRHTITADEFRFADGWYSLYKKTGDVKYLDCLLAVIYRPKRKNYNPKNPLTGADCRQPFNNNTADWRINILGKLPLDKKLSIMLWYEGCRALLPQKYPNLFNGDNQDEADKHGWTAVFVNHAGAEMGTQEQIKNTLLVDLLTALDIRVQAAKQLEKKLKK